MRKKNGFTLIELLGVIVILALIALITTPMILGMIEKVKKGAFESSVKGIEDSIELENYEDEGKIINYTVDKGVITNTETNEVVHNKGGNNINGNIKVKKDGKIIYALNDGKKCIIKRDGQKKIEHISDMKFCTMEVATNLVKNGYGEYGDNNNFSKMLYEDGAFRKKGGLTIGFDEFIKVDTNRKYEYSIDMKNNSTNATYYVGLQQRDSDKTAIVAPYISYIKNTLTMLARDLNDGDTVVYFTSLNPAWLSSSGTLTDQLGFIFWNYQNSSGYEYAAETYSRNFYPDMYLYNAVDQANNIITLKSPWNKGKVKAGTQVSRSSSGASHSYGLLKGTMTSEYQTFSNTIHGVKNYTMYYNYFTPATEYVDFIILENNSNPTNTITHYKNIVLREIEE